MIFSFEFDGRGPGPYSSCLLGSSLSEPISCPYSYLKIADTGYAMRRFDPGFHATTSAAKTSRRTTYSTTTPPSGTLSPFTFSGAPPLLITMSKAVSTVDVMGESFLAGASVTTHSHHAPLWLVPLAPPPKPPPNGEGSLSPSMTHHLPHLAGSEPHPRLPAAHTPSCKGVHVWLRGDRKDAPH